MTFGPRRWSRKCRVTEMIPSELLRECFIHGQECYPEEACGFISGFPGEKGVCTKVYRMENILNRLHEEDPVRFPRNAREGYFIDPLSHLKLERELKERGEVIRIIYHSHPDVGAYFSEKDHEDALWDGRPRYPGIHYLVCGITGGEIDGAVLVKYDNEKSGFNSVRLDL